MQEDIAGTLRTIGHNVKTCTICGSPYPSQELTPVEATPDHGVLSAHEDICPQCSQSLAQGDDPAASAVDSGGPAY